MRGANVCHWMEHVVTSGGCADVHFCCRRESNAGREGPSSVACDFETVGTADERTPPPPTPPPPPNDHTCAVTRVRVLSGTDVTRVDCSCLYLCPPHRIRRSLSMKPSNGGLLSAASTMTMTRRTDFSTSNDSTDDDTCAIHTDPSAASKRPPPSSAIVLEDPDAVTTLEDASLSKGSEPLAPPSDKPASSSPPATDSSRTCESTASEGAETHSSVTNVVPLARQGLGQASSMGLIKFKNNHTMRELFVPQEYLLDERVADEARKLVKAGLDPLQSSVDDIMEMAGVSLNMFSPLSRVRQFAFRVITSHAFEHGILSVIVLSAVSACHRSLRAITCRAAVFSQTATTDCDCILSHYPCAGCSGDPNKRAAPHRRPAASVPVLGHHVQRRVSG